MAAGRREHRHLEMVVDFLAPLDLLRLPGVVERLRKEYRLAAPAYQVLVRRRQPIKSTRAISSYVYAGV